MSSLRRAIDEVRSGTVSSPPSRDRSAIDTQIKKLLGEIEVGWETIRSGQIDWSPAALQELLHHVLPGAEVLVISNREPYIHTRAGFRTRTNLLAADLGDIPLKSQRHGYECGDRYELGNEPGGCRDIPHFSCRSGARRNFLVIRSDSARRLGIHLFFGAENQRQESGTN